MVKYHCESSSFWKHAPYTVSEKTFIANQIPVARQSFNRLCLSFRGLEMIIDHNNPTWKKKQAALGAHKYNGAYYYSKEIVENIIPYIKTDRPWVTVNVQGECMDNAIVFIHSNIKTESIYKWLERYENLVLVCGVPETVEKVAHLGKAFYLPLSIDTKYVKQFAVPKKDKLIAFAGRVTKDKNIPSGVPKLQGIERVKLLKEMAHFRYVYAIGRTALEAKCLGCTLLPYDPRFLDVERWQVLDNKDVIPRLQTMLDSIDE